MRALRRDGGIVVTKVDEMQAKTDALVLEAVAVSVKAERQADELDRTLALVRAGLWGGGQDG